MQEPWIDPWVRKIPWRRKWQPTPAFLPGESHGQRSLAGYSPLGPKELDMTEWLTHTHTHTHTPEKYLQLSRSWDTMSGKFRESRLPGEGGCRESLCREPAWGTPPLAKVMRKEARHTQRRDGASGVPLKILEHLPPKPESAYFTALCSHLHLWLYGGLSPTTSLWKKVKLQLQLIKFLGVTRVF